MKSDRAFTLIELLAVMVILGVLMTLLAPAALAVKRQTTLATSSSALRQLSIAAQTYLGENNGRFFVLGRIFQAEYSGGSALKVPRAPRLKVSVFWINPKALSAPISPILPAPCPTLPSPRWGPVSNLSSKTATSVSA